MTKFIIVLALIIAIIPASRLFASYASVNVEQAQKRQGEQAAVSTAAAQDNVAIPLLMGNIGHQGHSGNLPAEDNGKIHTFHFDRLRKSRRQAVWLLLAKVLLLLTHACWIAMELSHMPS